MKKFNLIILVMTLFSFVAGSLSGLKQVHAETTKTELIDEKYLKVDYDCEEKDDENLWRISFKRQSEDENFDQRLKLKVTDEKDKTIDYPAVDSMNQKDEWLVEEKFSQTMEGQVALKLPKSVEKLQLYVQLDQREAGKEDAKIYEDTLDRETPFELKLKNDKDEKKEDVKKKERTVTVTSEEFVGPKTETQLNDAQKQAEMDLSNARAVNSNKYTKKAPTYKYDNGTYPGKAWTPIGQTNVINHQGGNEKEMGVWDGRSSWNTNNNNYTYSYINYGVEGNRSDISLRKYAAETNQNDVFDVRLNVRGNSINRPGADIYFVLDNSGSMGFDSTKIEGEYRKTLAVNSMQKLIDKFKNNLPEGGNYMRVGAAIYSEFSLQSSDPISELFDKPADWQKLVNSYDATTPYGNTYTQAGIEEARLKLNASGPGRRKIILLLTDGAPNLSQLPIDARSDSNMYYDKYRITRSSTDKTGQRLMANQQFFPTKIPGYGYKLQGTGQYITSHLTPANSTAADIREEGTEIHTIAIGIKPASGTTDHDTNQLITGLYKMASLKGDATGDTEKDHLFYRAEKKSDFDLSFEEWYESILSTVEKGTINDPLGDDVELVGEPSIKDVSQLNGKGTKAINTNGKMAEVSSSSDRRTIEVKNINLYGNQEIQVDYKVRLKPAAQDGKWHQTNGTTTLTPTPGRTNDELEFGVPSVKFQRADFVIPVKKVWNDTYDKKANYWGLRPNSVNVTLYRKEPLAWVPVQTIPLNGSSWEGSFNAVEGGSNIYRVVEERVTGYKPPTYNYGTEFTAASLKNYGNKVEVKNELLTGSTHFIKHKEDGKIFPNGSDKPRFSVKCTDETPGPQNIEPDSTGKVTIPDLPIGDYILEETHVPEGYVKMGNKSIKVKESSDGKSVIITIDGQQAGCIITNKKKDVYIINVEKIWEDKHNGTEDYWGMRSKSVEFEVLEKKGNPPTYEPLNPPVKLTLNQANNWKETFTTYEKDTVYKLKEVNRAPGYNTPYDVQHEFAYTSVKDGAAKIRNTLLKGTYSFYKYMDDGKTKFTGDDLPEFTVRRKVNNKLEKVLVDGLKPDKDGKVTIKDIPVGDFVVTESHVPKGFEPMEDFNIKVTEKIDSYDSFNKPVYVAEVKSDLGSSPAINKLKPFDLTINKVNQDGDPLKGAKFKLTKPDGTSEALSGEGPTFTRNDLKAGNYTLEEIKVPDGHKGMETTLRFTIEKDGKVTIPTHPNVESKYKLEEGDKPNTITFTISNKRALPGVFPRTGGGTARTMFKIAFALSGIAGILGAGYWLYSRKG